MELAEKRLEEIRESLKKEIGKAADLDLNVRSGGVLFPPEGTLPYTPNAQDYERVKALAIYGERSTHIQVQAHGIGSKFRGLIGILTVLLAGNSVRQASNAPFQVNYAEPYPSIERRFRVWLEESLVNALTLWRRSL
jgi:hypothetical protein